MIGFGGLSRLIAGMAVLAAMILGADATAATPAGPAAAVALPRLPAPLGLSFGMRPEEVPLPVVVPPPPLGVVTPPRPPVNASAPRSTSYRPAAAPTALFSSAAPVTGANTPATPPPRPASEVLPRQASQDGLGDYLRACEAAFDSVSALAAFDQKWLAWRAQHLRGGEGDRLRR